MFNPNSLFMNLNIMFTENCTVWNSWVDTYQPSIRNKNDYEPIDSIISASPNCKEPIIIECRTATPDHTPAKSTGQNVVCNLWDGLQCNSSQIEEPICFNYEVRLGCLRHTPECGKLIVVNNYCQVSQQSHVFMFP